MQLVYKSIQRKNLFSPTLLSVSLFVGLAAIVSVLGVNLAHGQFMQTPQSLLCDLPTDMTYDTWYIYQESIYGSYEAMPQQVKDQNTCAVSVDMFGSVGIGFKADPYLT